jgi:hypothetical protein
VVWKIKLSKRKGKGRGCQGSIARRTPLLERTLWLYYRPPLWLWPYTILWASKMDKIFAHAAVLSDKASHVRLFQDTYVLQCKTWMDQRIESRTIYTLSRTSTASMLRTIAQRKRRRPASVVPSLSFCLSPIVQNKMNWNIWRCSWKEKWTAIFTPGDSCLLSAHDRQVGAGWSKCPCFTRVKG